MLASDAPAVRSAHAKYIRHECQESTAARPGETMRNACARNLSRNEATNDRPTSSVKSGVAQRRASQQGNATQRSLSARAALIDAATSKGK